jgi:CRP-like cAMP-binding protein
MFELPLSRTEIGQFLGLRVETVSRQFKALKAEGVIRTAGSRKVAVVDPARLAWHAEHMPDESSH